MLDTGHRRYDGKPALSEFVSAADCHRQRLSLPSANDISPKKPASLFHRATLDAIERMPIEETELSPVTKKTAAIALALAGALALAAVSAPTLADSGYKEMIWRFSKR
jgi:hypothetical protein